MDALTKGTSLLPKIEILPPNKVIATNTVECMKAGIIFGSAGAIDGVLDRFTESLVATGDEEWSIVATGGLASTICSCCRHKIILDENLLLKGLKIIWDKNRGNRRKTKS
jgi:type III pantothenate kinase